MKLDLLTIFVTDLLLIDPVLSKSTAIHKTAKTKKIECKIMPKSESRILKKVVGFFSLGKWSSNGFATTTTQIQCTVTQFANTLSFELIMS